MAATWKLEGFSYREQGRFVEPVPFEAICQMVGAKILQASDRVWTVWSDGEQKRLLEFTVREAVPTA